jgi:predicted dehydrogenase
MGTGFWSTLQIPAWFEVGNVELAALYNRTVSKAEEAAIKYGVPKVYDDPEKLLQNEELDFVDIITEVPAHAPLVLLAAKYKVPVICQKPMGPDYETCVKMVAACKEAGISFFIHENWRWQPHFRYFKSILDQKPIGRIRRVEFSQFNRGRTCFANQPFIKSLPHYIITDGGSHLFDLARFYFGEPESVYCHALKTYEELAGEDSMTAVLRYKDMICACSFSEHVKQIFFIDGEDGTLELLIDGSVIITTSEGRQVLTPPVAPKYEWASHVYSYLDAGSVHNIVECN